MPTSDSDDFESADEGQTSPQKKERKKRLSSSNYSDNLESDQENKKGQSKTYSMAKKETTDGWDDFDIDEGSESITKVSAEKDTSVPKSENTTKTDASTINTEKGASNDSGWTDFDDWGDTDPPKTGKDNNKQPDRNVQEVTEQLAASTTSTKNEGWGWGWGMDSILSTATAGITNLTSQVSQGISTVLETSIGAPDPEELARKTSQGAENKCKTEENLPKEVNNEKQEDVKNSEAQFQFGSLLSGVTKFVETTGTKVLAGGLDTLETIGKKTMEVLQDGDPGLVKKRAMLGLDAADKPVLSQVLREAKAKADEEDRIKEQKREAKEVHYETLFDDFEGLVHLEALEMLSRQVSMRIEERIRVADPSKRQDIKETLQQVAVSLMTVVITKHIGDIATLFTARLNSITDEDKEQISNHITNIFLEADNSCKYIQNAFQLALPIIQIGAV
ncbi:PREDICTED: protein FAM114A2-like [Papilio polytes]|uniref:protein FAM114A2-like n=1 Tax=Papilio polytes TaxID=76194 RepID=UPI0006765E19|nr:PREDICTED: protein FAM114A2-like [Papilio polytes]